MEVVGVGLCKQVLECASVVRRARQRGGSGECWSECRKEAQVKERVHWSV